MGYQVFLPTVLTSTDVNTYLMKQTVMVFADATARGLALTAPAAGMVTYLTGTNALNTYNGSSWVVTGVTSAVAGTGISVSGATGAVTVTNTGVTSLVAGTNITLSGATGAVTISATGGGVTSAVAGTGISVSGATGAVTFTNTGVTSAVAGTGVGVSGATGAVTFSIGQSVATTANPTFVNITATTVATTGNITSSTLVAANTLLYADALKIRMGAWSLSPNYSTVEGNKGFLILGNTQSDNIFLRTFAGTGTVRIGGNNGDTLVVGDGTTSISGNLGTSTYITCSYLAAGATGLTDGGSVSASGWFRATGNTGIYFQDWGGGWHMTDSSWIRAYNNKPMYVASEIRTGDVFSANTNRSRGTYGSISIGSNGVANGWDGVEFVQNTQTFMVYSDFYSGVYRNNNTWNWLWNYSTLQVPSDERYKREIEPLGLGMKFIEQLNPVSFLRVTEREDDDPDATEEGYYYGFTAQNVRAALDVCGETRDVKIHDIGGPNMGLVACVEGAVYDRQFIGISEFIAPVVEAIKELNVRLKTLEGV